MGFTAGNIAINAREVEVTSGSEITVSSRGEAGNLNIFADRITLDSGDLTAVAGQGEGGANISLDLSQDSDLDNFVRLRNESLISANARGSAAGGNIAIDADFIFAEYPTGDEGSDIIANAEAGDGGSIRIDAPLGVYGLVFRSERTPLNDITVSSESGSSGIFTRNTLANAPDSGLPELTAEFVDASGQATDRCAVDAGKGSKIEVTGRGGLPATPTDILGAPIADNDDWVSLASDPTQSLAPAVERPGALIAATVQSLHQQSLCHRAYQDSQESL